jgi:rare lipoprotein A
MYRFAVLGAIVGVVWLLSGCGARAKAPAPAPQKNTSDVRVGLASFYGPQWHGHLTANGERLDIHAMTAAHRTLPFGTRVRVTLLQTGKSVVVRINDRGPYVHGRIIDLTDAAARAIGLTTEGVGRVRLEVLP